MYGKGRPESTASGVRTWKIFSRKSLFSSSRWGSSSSAQRSTLTPASRSAGITSSLKIRAWRSASGTTFAEIAESCSRGVSPSDERVRMPAAACCFSPATRTWKNSSRLLAKIARNFARSSNGVSLLLGQRQHAGVEVDRRELAVEVPVLHRGLARGGRRRSDVPHCIQSKQPPVSPSIDGEARPLAGKVPAHHPEG